MSSIQDLYTGGELLPITRWGTPVMHQPTTPVTEFGDELHTLVRNMFATMKAAEGVGLAATQVGVGISLFVYDCPDDDGERHIGAICNPTVTLPEGKDRVLVSIDEGCLSYPGAFQPLARPDFAVCEGDDVFGNPIRVEGTGFFARCLQHETDHLSGTVFGDRLTARNRKRLTKEHDERAERYPDDWPVHPRRVGAQSTPEPDEARNSGAAFGLGK